MEGEREERGDACGGREVMRRDGGGAGVDGGGGGTAGRCGERGPETTVRGWNSTVTGMSGNECGDVCGERDEGWWSDKGASGASEGEGGTKRTALGR